MKKKKKKEKSKYNRSFANRLTRWIMLVLLVMMGGLSYMAFNYVKSVIVSLSGEMFEGGLQTSSSSIIDVMSDVSIAVENNIFDIERNIDKPDQLPPIVERIVDVNFRIRSCGISFTDSYYRQKGRWYCPYAWRDSTSVKSCNQGGPDNNYLEADWFLEAIQTDSAYWSKPFFADNDGKTPLVAYMYPIHDRQGRIVATLGADLSLDFVTKILREQDQQFNHEIWEISLDIVEAFCSYVVKRDGTYITHPDEKQILKGNFFDIIKDIDPQEEKNAARLVESISNGEKSAHETHNAVMVNDTESYLFFTPLKDTDWMLVTMVPKILLDIVGIVIGVLLLVVIVLVMLATFFVCRITIKRVAKPVKLLAAAADEVAKGQFDVALPHIKSRDEICQLRDSFENMQRSLTVYIEEQKAAAKAKASIESELKVAHEIQMSMLPKAYPAFPDRHDIDIFGQLTPAKAVGGDLYDFFILDEKLFFCIGDVSGKGVPASLVMAVTRSLFRNIANHVAEPDKIAYTLNEAMSSNNDTNMFVTLFVGVLDLATGSLSYSNAGHNNPLLLANGTVTDIFCDANIPIGVMPGWTFTPQQIQLQTDNTVFLYTDGLNEAEDINHEQFGMDRVCQTALTADACPQPLIDAMAYSVRLFVGVAEQSDDLTMLAIQYKK